MDLNQKSLEVITLDNLREDVLQKVVDFLNGFLPNGSETLWSVEYFRWKLMRNPAGQGFLSCAIANGAVIGTASITLKRIFYKNRVLIAGGVGDLYVNPEFRWRCYKNLVKKQQNTVLSFDFTPTEQQIDYLNRSILGSLLYDTLDRALKRGIRIIYGFPNKYSRSGMEKRLNFKAHPMQEAHLHRPCFSILGSYRNTTFLYNTFPIKQIATMIAEVEWLFESINFKYWNDKRKKIGYAIEETDDAADDFNQLWECLKFRTEFSLIRDQSYFRHRFFENPIAKYKVYKAALRGSICGAIVTRLRLIPGRGKYCCVADWFFDETKEYLFPIMLAHVIHEQYSQKVGMFTAWSGQGRNDRSYLHKFGFISTSKWPILFYNNESGGEIINSCLSLDLTLASSENI